MTPPTPPAPPAPVWQRLRRDRVATACAALLLLLVLAALAAPLVTALTGHPPDQLHPERLDPDRGGLPLGPAGGIGTGFWLGVEPGTGRDLLSRAVHGARVSLAVAFGAAALTALLGTAAGLCAGYFGGRVDAALGRLTDLFLCFPALVSMIALAAVLPDLPRLPLLIGLLSAFAWPALARLVRAETITLCGQGFVEAAEAAGRSPRSVLLRELLPHLAAPLSVHTALAVPAFIETEAALSFLGLGVQPPTASWGQMLSTAAPWLTTDPEYALVPGTLLLLTTLSCHLLGDGLRAALDPRGR
ncbi:ABC transporter permease [Kitasatospora cineracea]|uniref:Peptide/nickel transport system permease protein n=1 Tax=Kitasatospora cineracea TaxID=88074 RepID=A0A8G1ULV8_9ACTN|nr:ABC transporter permease [Kitasatospora cineracea]ROR46392.1 peptide/nickel transport system permease protein [Kitasatospora cineracea]